MPYGLLAELVLLLHLAFILFVVLGGLLVLRQPRLAWLHLPAVLWGLVIEFSAGTCPLTPLENTLRQLGGERGYGGDFIAHYLMPLIYPPGLDSGLQFLLGGLVLAINALVYWRLFRRVRHRPRG